METTIVYWGYILGFYWDRVSGLGSGRMRAYEFEIAPAEILGLGVGFRVRVKPH